MNKTIPIALALIASVLLVTGCLGGEGNVTEQPPAGNQTQETVSGVNESLESAEESLNSSISDLEELGNLSSLTVEEDL